MVSPATDVCEMLAEAKRQRAPFDLAWGQVVALLRCDERDSWVDALRETKWGWRNAYEDVPQRQSEEALRAWQRVFKGRAVPPARSATRGRSTARTPVGGMRGTTGAL
jgi:hypothetical protein